MLKMDDGGVFGRNRLYYYWMLKKYKQGTRTEKLKYWMFQKEKKEWQSMNELKRRSRIRAIYEQKRSANRCPPGDV